MGIPENVAARKAAEAMAAIAIEEASKYDNQAACLFWVTLYGLLTSRHEDTPPKTAELQPMSDKESRRFGNRLMEFGKFSGTRIDEVPMAYLEWLDDQPDFRMELHRYLASKRIQAEGE